MVPSFSPGRRAGPGETDVGERQLEGTFHWFGGSGGRWEEEEAEKQKNQQNGVTGFLSTQLTLGKEG